MPTKCDKCDKSITKKIPGLECHSCSKVVHATQTCAELTTKQLAAIRNANSLDWTCGECQAESPRRKSSFIIPEEEEEDSSVQLGDCIGGFDPGKFLVDMTQEMKRILKEELQPIERSLNLCCTKIDELYKTVECHGDEIKLMQNKYKQIENEQSHQQLEVKALKQYVRSIEQQNLDEILEVSGVPQMPNEDLTNIGVKMAAALKMDYKNISFVKRLHGRKDRPGLIHVRLSNIIEADVWLKAAKKQPVTVNNLIDDASALEKNCTTVRIRKALSKSNKILLWQAQQKLRPNFKHVWFQDGKALARIDDGAKPYVARCEEDIDTILEQLATMNR